VGQPEVDPQEFLDRMKAEHQVLRWEPLQPDTASRTGDNQQVRDRSSLEYLHQHWALPDQFDPAHAGGGSRGKFVQLFGRLTYRVLGPYFRQERDLLAHLVRVSEALEGRCDELNLRCQQLDQDFVDRQVAEARNLTELALWLHLDHPASVDPGHQGNVGGGDAHSEP
jgi:hypothetical protein